jgi:hypothetical protein
MSPRPFTIVFCILVGLGLPASNADASPFVITLLGSGGSGGQGDDGNASVARNASVDGRVGSSDYDASDADRLGLSVRGRRTTATWPAFGFPGGALSLIPAIKRALAAADVLGPSAFLDLGDGEYLAVSSDVAESLVRGVAADSSPTDGHNGAGQVPSVPSSHSLTPTVANDVTVSGDGGGSGLRLGPKDPAGALPPGSNGPFGSNGPSGSNGPFGSNGPSGSNGPGGNDMIGGVLADVSSGLVSSPPEAGSSLAEAAAKGLAPAAEAPAHAPEPATLILLASALAITARRLRRPRT